MVRSVYGCAGTARRVGVVTLSTLGSGYARKDTTANPDYKGERLSDADIDSIINKHGGA